MRTKTLLSLLTLVAVGGGFILLTVVRKKEGPFNVGNSSKVYSLKVKKNGKTGYWLYEIYRLDKLMIKQEFVPSLSLKMPFASEQEAKIIGELVLSRLNKNLPPTLTLSEVERHLEIKK